MIPPQNPSFPILLLPVSDASPFMPSTQATTNPHPLVLLSAIATTAHDLHRSHQAATILLLQRDQQVVNRLPKNKSLHYKKHGLIPSLLRRLIDCWALPVWSFINPLAKRPRFESAGNLSIYPQKIGREKQSKRKTEGKEICDSGGGGGGGDEGHDCRFWKSTTASEAGVATTVTAFTGLALVAAVLCNIG